MFLSFLLLSYLAWLASSTTAEKCNNEAEFDFVCLISRAADSYNLLNFESR